MSLREILAVLLGNNQPILIPVPVNNGSEQKS